MFLYLMLLIDQLLDERKLQKEDNLYTNFTTPESASKL